MNLLRRVLGLIPTLLLSFALAIAVWISAMTSNDPIEERVYPKQVQIEIIGQDPTMILTVNQSDLVTIRLSAPRSIWDRLVNDPVPVRAVVDMAGAGPGVHDLNVQIQIGISPYKIISYSPTVFKVSLEKLESQNLPVNIVRKGEPAVGYEAGTATLDQTSATISGPKSQVDRVKSLQVSLDINRANDNISRSLSIQPVDENGQPVTGLGILPEQTTVTQPITQRGGYRNVVVKVVTTGQVGEGYRLTTVSVFPPTVTVFASNPSLVDKLPGYIETSPIEMNARKDDIDMRLPLNLPEGVSVVGDPTVNVIVGISAIEGSLTLNDIEVEVIGLDPRLTGKISPERINIILSGPLPTLDRLLPGQVRAVLDLTGKIEGVYQLVPNIDLNGMDLQVESILPGSIEVTIGLSPTPSPTPKK
jgi:YbbR domain-containing protein